MLANSGLLKRFLSHVKTFGHPKGCWEWQAAKSERGYGTFRIGSLADKTRRQEQAHRVAWELFRGRIPNGLNVLHKCDNPPCVNPDHLFLGTLKDNSRDMVGKKRNWHPNNNGSNNGRAKLNWVIVRQIRASYQGFYGEREAEKLAEKYGVNPATIRGIISAKTWKEPNYAPPTEIRTHRKRPSPNS